METPTRPSIPLELMEILHSIKDDIGDVRERVIRLEAQNHSDSFKTIWYEFEKEREKRIRLQIDIASIKTKMAPITIAISLFGAAVIDVVFRTFAH
jgi:predicted  nucleic acid-binding Zn-ribbon protein